MIWWLFSWLDWKYGFWEENHSGRATFWSHCEYTLWTWLITADVDFCHWAEVMFVRFLSCKITRALSLSLPLLAFYCSFWEDVIVHHPPIRSEQLCSTLWGERIYISYLELYCMGYFPFSMFFLLTYLSISVWTDGYLFYTLDYKTQHYNLCWWSFSDLAIENSWSFDIPHLCVGFFLALPFCHSKMF